MYDIIDNTYSVLCSYPDHEISKAFLPNCHGHFLMPNTHKLYLYGGFRQRGQCIAILDLKSLEWQVLKRDDGIKYDSYDAFIQPDTVCILDNDLDHQHPLIFCADYKPSALYKFDCIKTKFTFQGKCNINAGYSKNCHLLYLEYCKKLVLLNVNHQGQVLWSDINISILSGKHYEWKDLCNIPVNVNENTQFAAVTAFDGRVIVLLQSHTEIADYDDYIDQNKNSDHQKNIKLNYIWCFDVEDKKWINTNIENNWNNYVHLVRHENIMHIINTGDAAHFTIDLFDVIPPALMKKHQQRFEILVSGFISDIKYDAIPHEIISLIAMFVVVI